MSDLHSKGLFGRPIPRQESLASMKGSPPKPDATEGATIDRHEDLVDRFLPRAASCRLSDVVMSEVTALEVAAMLAKVEHFEVLYQEWGLARLEPSGGRLVFNLYGPPGTGKTMLADALAANLRKQVIEVNYAEVESKYVGDTPKNIVAAFRSAEKHDAVLFFDEADSILGKRMTNVTQAADHGVNVSRAVMLKELDRSRGTVMFATNLARNFDPAFVRRILFHIPMLSPDAAGRERLWRGLIPDTVPGKSGLDFLSLANLSEGMVGGDIKNAILLAALDAVQRQSEARKICLADLERAIDRVLRAKKDVGARERASPTWSMEGV